MADIEESARRIAEELRKKPELLKKVQEMIQEDPAALRLVLCQDWTEHERGWGCRPDGHTLHLDRADRDAFVKGYDETWNTAPSAPDEYTQADGRPRLVKIDEETYQCLLAQREKQIGEGEGELRHEHHRYGIWGHSTHYGPKAYEGE